MTVPLRKVTFREWRAGCVLMTLACGHGAAAQDDRSGLVRCPECST